MEAINKIFLDENTGGKGRYFRTRFLQPGLVKYSFGVCLLEKETIDKFIYNFVGCPVIINHQDVTDENAKDLRVGVISRVWYESVDGWYWGEGVITDKKALELINDGFNVSCQYEITEYAKNNGKLHNGNEYDKVILNGKPEHLAIVENPRYENAMIAVNALEVENYNFNHDKDGKFAKILAEKMKDKEEKEKEKKEEKTLEDKLKETDVARLHFEMQQEKAKNAIIQAINEIKDNNMFRCLFKKKENAMDKEEMKSIFMECLTELTASNEADKKDEDKEAENKCKNEEPDYKKLYEELKAKMEKAQNEEDEDKENKEEVLEEKVEKEAENKAKNKAKNSIEEQKDLINSGKVEPKVTYITQAKARELGKELF